MPGATLRIAKNAPEQSGLLLLLSAPRRTDLAMPPFATELPDTDTEDAVRAWIQTLQ